MTRFIYKLVRPQEWQKAQEANIFTGSPVDLADGFIHFSTETQVRETAAKHFTDSPLIYLLKIDCEQLSKEQLKWEPSRGGALFPHLYGPLPLTTIIDVSKAAVNKDGVHVFVNLPEVDSDHD